MNKYNINIKLEDLNPMSTAPLWGYYDGGVETVILFFRDKYLEWDIVNVVAHFDRELNTWIEWYSRTPIDGDFLGWLPDYTVVE